jgi:hypothetical protein
MNATLPELDFIGQLTPDEASRVFEQRVQALVNAGVVSPDGDSLAARRNTAAGLLKNLFPALVKRLAKFD